MILNKAFHTALACVLLLAMTSISAPAWAYDQSWNGYREDITGPCTTCEPPPPCQNCCPGSTGSPVYLANGTLVWNETDIRFPTDTNVRLKR
ncbi:MAG: hypothetical protein KUG80_04775, partial [Gammaproteobacteria bacterium]|nr:hypothetical protein [Gammaproteobacteria bacterium]